MKFAIPFEHGIRFDMTVWDADKNAPLATFVGGELETDDEYVISKLIELGYGEPEPQKPEPEEPKKPEVDLLAELRAKAKELGIEKWHVKGIDTLAVEIAEKEGK